MISVKGLYSDSDRVFHSQCDKNHKMFKAGTNWVWEMASMILRGHGGEAEIR